jgi:hypothetical protein
MSSVDATSTKKSNAALKSQTPYQLVRANSFGPNPPFPFNSMLS